MDQLPEPTVSALREALRAVIDPENGVNIVDLGLVYDIRIDGGVATVVMTLTSPACPMGDMILEEVDAALVAVLPRDLVPDVEVVWEPAWEPALMSAAARAHFGW